MILSDLPTELLYTILSHRLGDIVFQYLFLDALVADSHGQSNTRWQAHATNISKSPPTTQDPLSEIISLASVCVGWRSVLWRILSALLAFDGPQNSGNGVPSHKTTLAGANQLTRLTASRAIMQTGKQAPPSFPVMLEHNPPLQSQISDHSIEVASHNPTVTLFYSMQPYLCTLWMMQKSLRTLTQQSIDMYKEEQEASHGFMGPTAGQTPGGVTPPHPGTLTPTFTPSMTPIASTSGSTVPLYATTGTPITGSGMNGQTQMLVIPPAPLTPLSILPRVLDEYNTSPDVFAFPTLSRPAELSAHHPNHEGSSTIDPLSIFEQTPPHATTSIESRRLWVWGFNSLFVDALGYTQSSLFTCSRSSTHRSDLSLALTAGRLQGALELLDRMIQGPKGSIIVEKYAQVGMVRPKEVAEVIRCGVDGARQRVQEARQVCEWNDLLDRVFLRGERSDELIDKISDCFSAMENQWRSIQMLHLLRSGLFKTIQTIGRMNAISLYPSSPGGFDRQSNESVSDTSRIPGESKLLLPKEWKSRAANLSMLWTGRVIEWTGF